MAQNFVGSNNINLLEPKGQFGTRGMGGKDAASARYIHTYLTQISKLVFHDDDKWILNYLSEEGQSIEPEYYVPVIPMVLVNGGEGIGTGWSTFIPCYNPKDIIQALKNKMEGKEFERLNPWFKHYHGEIAYTKNSYLVKGHFEHNEADKMLKITELPIRKWTKDYKQFLEKFLEDDTLIDMKEYHGINTVDFEIFYDKKVEFFKDDDTIFKKFNLTTTLSDNNYVLFDRNNRLKRYADETEIMDEFYELRLEYYHKRKDYLLRKLNRDLEILDNKVRFITEVVNEDIVVNKKRKKELLKILRERGYTKYLDIVKKVPEEFKQKNESKGLDDEEGKEADEENEEDQGEVDRAKDYDYLLSMPIWNLTEEKIEDLKRQKKAKEKDLEILQNTEVLNIWREDLDKILVELDKIEEKEINIMMKTKNKGAKGKNVPKPKKKSNNGKEKTPPPKKDRTKKPHDLPKKEKNIVDIIKK